MSMELLFERRVIVGENLLNIIRDNGYTKSSFAKAIDITRPTLDRLLAGEIESLTRYRQYINKITEIQDITEEQILNYAPRYNPNNESGRMVRSGEEQNGHLVLLHSFNAPDNHEIKEQAKEIFLILEDILNICEVYYGK